MRNWVIGVYAICLLQLASPLLAQTPEINNSTSEKTQKNENTVPNKKPRHGEWEKKSPEESRNFLDGNFPGWEKMDSCYGTDKTPIPPNVLPTPEIAKSLAKCSSVDFYWGIHVPTDFAKARHCAFLEREKKNDDNQLGGTGLLMMIFANGDGVERNLDLAIRFACEYEGDGSGAIVDQLKRLKEENWKGKDFDICDFSSTSFQSAHCGHLTEQIQEIERHQKLTNLMKSWGDLDSKAFKVLEKAFDSYVQAHSENEVHCGGNAWCAVFSIEQRTRLNDDFFSNLNSVESGQFPRFTKKEFIRIDQELNSIYLETREKFKKDDKDNMYASVTDMGIKETQRAWLKYRDSWVSFAKQRYPKVAEESWKAWLTKKRIKILEEL